MCGCEMRSCCNVPHGLNVSTSPTAISRDEKCAWPCKVFHVQIVVFCPTACLRSTTVECEVKRCDPATCSMFLHHPSCTIHCLTDILLEVRVVLVGTVCTHSCRVVYHDTFKNVRADIQVFFVSTEMHIADPHVPHCAMPVRGAHTMLVAGQP